MSLNDASLPSTVWQKYDSYGVPVDAKQNDRSTVMKLNSFRRPHMRAFWVSTFSFFIAFTAWFSFAPLLPEVKKDLHLNKIQINNSNIFSVCATVLARFIVGPLSDVWGARIVFSLLLFCGSIPTYCSGLVQSAKGLYALRTFIGILGATFVCNQAWMSQMFSKEIVGAANATSAGWGNLGGGATQMLMVTLWSGMKNITSTSEQAWRLSFLIPATLVLMCSFATFFLGDDTPKGNYTELIKHGATVRQSSKKSAKQGSRNINSWILALHYAASFGTEIVVFNVCASYFHDEFGLSTHKAGYVASSFGFLNIFSRALGGWCSDKLYKYFGEGSTGMRGRVLIQFICVLLEGILLIIFSHQDSLNKSIAVLIFFALFVQMANGTLYGIVPYVEPESTGSVSGIVGAGGNAGAVAWLLMIRFGPISAVTNFRNLGYIVCGIACTAPLIAIKGHDGMFHKAKQALPPATI